jgi:hypothetical protein
MKSRWSAIVCAGAVFAFAGCGRADDRQAVGVVTERFLGAISDGNGQRACAQLSDGAQQALEQDESERCPEAVRGLDDEIERSTVTRAEVFGTTAKVDLADGQSAFLELTRRGWRVAAVGCRPEGADEPYQCVLEA